MHGQDPVEVASGTEVAAAPGQYGDVTLVIHVKVRENAPEFTVESGVDGVPDLGAIQRYRHTRPSRFTSRL